MQTMAQDPVFVSGKVETPRHFAQLILPVLDGSGSMTEPARGHISKAQATNMALRELLTRIKISGVAQNFTCGVLTFDQAVTERLAPTSIASVDDNGNYDPLDGHGGGTSIFLALEEAERVVDRFLLQAPDGGVPHTAVILLMSDGCCSRPDLTRTIAQRIKTGPNGYRVTIACTLCGTVGSVDTAGEALLREVASDPVKYYKTVYDAETLRAFMLASASAESGGQIP